jgi:hypothetical protein
MSMSDQSGLAAFFESMRPDMEHADRVRAALPKPIAAVFFSRDGKALDITLDTNANDYSDWIKGEGADIGLKRDRDTEKVVGAHLPLYAKTLMIGGDDMPTLLVDIATGKVTQWPEREAPLTPAPPAKRLEDRDRTFPYEAACSGLRYENPASCGDVAAIWLDGKRWEVLDRSALTAAEARELVKRYEAAKRYGETREATLAALQEKTEQALAAAEARAEEAEKERDAAFKQAADFQRNSYENYLGTDIHGSP